MGRTIESDVKKAIRKCWPASRKSSVVCLTEREFEKRIDDIMEYLSVHSSKTTLDGEKDTASYCLASPEIRAYLVDRLSPQWVRLIDDESEAKRERIKHYPSEPPTVKPAPVRQLPKPPKDDGYDFMRLNPNERKLRWKSGL